MKVCEIFNEAFRTSCVASLPSLEIAQRFNAGSSLGHAPKSRQGRKNRGRSFALLSSLNGLRHFGYTIFPALKRWAIFGRTDGRERDTLRLAS
jgi:hypothetical protein